jgi:hypothetical protein
MRRLLISLLGITLLGCSATLAQAGWDDYIGRPISDLAMRMGPPTTVSRGPNGWPIFEWSHLAPTKGIVIEGLLIHGRCNLKVMTRPARSSPTAAMADWLVTHWRFAGLGCLYQ